MMALWRDTLRGVLAPARVVPIVALAIPLMVAQHVYSVRPWTADLIAASMVIGFVLIGPFSWRLLFERHHPLRFALYPALAILPLLGGFVMTMMVERQPNFLVSSINGGVAAALFLVGGWGLGRDLSLERGLEAQRRQTEAAQLLAIRAQLDPHFLFNTLNAIAEWCAIDPVKAESSILALSKVLREVMQGIRAETWPLQRELAIARDVLQLHHLRDPDWFDLAMEGDPGEATVPPLLLLPLVENAITHGPAAGHRGTVRLEVDNDGDFVEIRLTNPGPFAGRRDGGEGLSMVESRLRTAYGSRASLGIRSEGETTLTTLRYPVCGGNP